MKKLYTLFFVFITMYSASFSQALPNGGFEYWNAQLIESPQYYPMTSNWDAFRRGLQPNATKVTDAQHGSFAIRLVTVSNSADTMFGYFINGDPGTGQGGIPLSETPTAVTGYYKCNIPVGDTALFLVICKSGGNVISFNVHQFYGTQNTYVHFTLPLNVPMTPDSVIIGGASSNAFQWNGNPGSMLQLDSISFVGISAQPSQLNGSFENWVSQTLYSPQSWLAAGDTALRTTDAYAGNYALKLTTMLHDQNNVGPSILTNGVLPNNGPPTGGVPYTNALDTLCGYYKFIPNGIDSATVWINLTLNGNPVGGVYTPLPPVSNYTYFEIPFMAGTPPDTMLIVMASTWSNTDISNAGSILYIDNLAIKSQPLHAPAINWNSLSLMKLYPNPVLNEVLYLEFDNRLANTPVTLTIKNLLGQTVYSATINELGPVKKTISLADYAKGTYNLILEQNGVKASRLFIIQ